MSAVQAVFGGIVGGWVGGMFGMAYAMWRIDTQRPSWAGPKIIVGGLGAGMATGAYIGANL